MKGARPTPGQELRAEVNRSFDKARLARAEVYGSYIERIEMQDYPGGTPAITVYAPEAELVPSPTGDMLVIPYGSPMVAIDGETQLEARCALRDRVPGTGRIPVALTIYFGIDEARARRILIDYNQHANPITPKLAHALDTSGAVTRAIEAALAKHGLTMLEHVSRSGDAGKPAGKKTPPRVALSQLHAFTVGHAMGDAALTDGYGRWMETLNAVGGNTIEPTTVDALAEAIHRAQTDQAMLTAASAIWQAAGVAASKGSALSGLKVYAAAAALDAEVARRKQASGSKRAPTSPGRRS